VPPLFLHVELTSPDTPVKHFLYAVKAFGEMYASQMSNSRTTMIFPQPLRYKGLILLSFYVISVVFDCSGVTLAAVECVLKKQHTSPTDVYLQRYAPEKQLK
jgi:hypothetical protein